MKNNIINVVFSKQIKEHIVPNSVHYMIRTDAEEYSENDIPRRFASLCKDLIEQFSEDGYKVVVEPLKFSIVEIK